MGLYHSSLVALLNNYKELSDDATYLLYLDDIISDLTLLQGKTVDEILTYLENA
jgi:hypothetical protein